MRNPIGGLVALLLFGGLCACGAPETAGEPEPEASPVTTDESPPATAPALPDDLHAAVFFDTDRGHEHLDVRVISDASTTTITGVRADESRAHPRVTRIELDADERAEYAARIAALGAMPRCEPLARLPDEPEFRIESDDYTDSGPSMWLREDGAALLASDDPCLAYVRLAHFIYATWMRHAEAP